MRLFLWQRYEQNHAEWTFLRKYPLPFLCVQLGLLPQGFVKPSILWLYCPWVSWPLLTMWVLKCWHEMLFPPDLSLVEVSLVKKKKKKRLPQSCVQLKGSSQHASVELTHDCSSDAECLQGIPHPASKGQGIVQYPRHCQCPEPEPPISPWRVSPLAITLSHCKSCHPLVSSQSYLLDWLQFWDFHIFCVLLLLSLELFFKMSSHRLAWREKCLKNSEYLKFWHHLSQC